MKQLSFEFIKEINKEVDIAKAARLLCSFVEAVVRAKKFFRL